jgi:hypothetical protein
VLALLEIRELCMMHRSEPASNDGDCSNQISNSIHKGRHLSLFSTCGWFQNFEHFREEYMMEVDSILAKSDINAAVPLLSGPVTPK